MFHKVYKSYFSWIDQMSHLIFRGACCQAWENDYRHHRCLKISRNCYETWSLQEAMVTAQKFGWSQARCWQLKYFLLEIFTPNFCGSDFHPIWRSHMFLRSVGWSVQPSTSSKWRRLQIQLGQAKRTANAPKRAWKTPLKPFCGLSWWWFFLRILPMVIHHEKKTFLLMNIWKTF